MLDKSQKFWNECIFVIIQSKRGRKNDITWITKIIWHISSFVQFKTSKSWSYKKKKTICLFVSLNELFSFKTIFLTDFPFSNFFFHFYYLNIHIICLLDRRKGIVKCDFLFKIKKEMNLFQWRKVVICVYGYFFSFVFFFIKVNFTQKTDI